MFPQLFSLSLPPSSIILICIAFAAIVFAQTWCSSLLRRTGKYSHEPRTPQPDSTLPSLTVVVYASGSPENLSDYVEMLMAQDYPDFNAVIVYDATAQSAEELSKSFKLKYPSLHLTFIPPGSRSLSRRKLAFMLGIKAATGDVVLTTTSSCSVPSGQWLSEMMEPFSADSSTDVVLGYSTFNRTDMRGIGKWYKEFDRTLTSAQWIGSALKHKPYRGDSHNLAFRRHLFFDNKGYAANMFLQWGDDDLFVCDIANAYNTVAVLSPESTVIQQWGSSSNRLWTDEKEHYHFTSRYLPRSPFLRAGALSAMQWFVPACIAGAYALTAPALTLAASGALMLIIFWLLEIALYRRVAGKLGSTRLWWAVPVFMMTRPVANFFYKLTFRRRRRKNYTWER